MKNKIRYLGIDIGGAHFKIIGLDANKSVCFSQYRKCYVWKGINNLKKEIDYINSLNLPKDTSCGITMTAELCDIFKSKKDGVLKISEQCKKLNLNYAFYTKKKKIFSRDDCFNYKDLISMNWHSIGKYFSINFEDLVIVDFGSTTTDFICIKNSKITNNGFDDFSRLSSREMFYSGIIRTPLFGLQHEIKIKKKKYHIVPELFSNTSDIYRINNFLEKEFDIDDEADNGTKGITESLLRISRSFCIDFEKNKKNLIYSLSQILINNQVEQINSNINYLIKKNKLKSNTPLIFTGIGRKILEKKITDKSVLKIDKLIHANNVKLKNFASQHMPAFCVAQLMANLKK
tara:strand:- start:193 stop:1230 length:1038 start_codon:yes stop_codon:yes gene_type:complete